MSSSWSYWRDRYYYVFLFVWSTTTTTTKPTTTATVRLRIRHSPTVSSLIVVCYFCYFARLFRYGRWGFRQSTLSMPPPLPLSYSMVAITRLRISLCIFVIRSRCVCVSLNSVFGTRITQFFVVTPKLCGAFVCACVPLSSLSFVLFSVSGKYVQINLYFSTCAKWVGRLEFQILIIHFAYERIHAFAWVMPTEPINMRMVSKPIIFACKIQRPIELQIYVADRRIYF